MEQKVALLHGNYYHIYNRGNNGIDVFLETENYYHFLRLYAKYIEPIADTYAWCLLKNHFHMFKFYFLVVTYGIAFIIIGVCLQQTCL
ncbi:hypothetical protein [Flavobacterium luteum]|uniref:hypothetical protein n=1 Tax=Flavobacterium luteum TaxID=2026654 RepID=UPI001CD9895B|nr:hypothetical protein [Flavobacterium luteum]